jgi:hypothetical protein
MVVGRISSSLTSTYHICLQDYEGILIRHCYFLFFLKAWILLFISGGETDPRMSGEGTRREIGHSISIYFCFIAVDYLL